MLKWKWQKLIKFNICWHFNWKVEYERKNSIVWFVQVLFPSLTPPFLSHYSPFHQFSNIPPNGFSSTISFIFSNFPNYFFPFSSWFKRTKNNVHLPILCVWMYVYFVIVYINNVVCCFRKRGSVLRLTTDSASSSLSVTFDPTRVTQLSWRPRSTPPLCIYTSNSVSISLYFHKFMKCAIWVLVLNKKN